MASPQELFKKADYKAAAAAAEKALRSAPDDFSNTLVLGLSLLQLSEFERASTLLKSCLVKRPSDAQLHFNCGFAYDSLGRKPEAFELFKQALVLDPAYVKARCKICEHLEALSERLAAKEICEKGLALDPGSADLRIALGNIFNSMGLVAEAKAEYEKAIASCGGYTRAGDNALLASQYIDGVDEGELFKRNREWSLHYEKEFPPRRLAPAPLEGRRIRIGYLSADFRRHSVAFFIEPVLACHDKSAFEVFCYSDVAKPDAITKRIASLVEHWRPTHGASDAELIAKIDADKLDVIVDLGGHTSTRLPLFARRLAPVQITWIGSPLSTGLSTMDYRITDRLADPAWTDVWHSEKLLRLPGCFLLFAPPDDAPELSEAPCLKNGFVTFGSFNAIMKHSPSCHALWASALKAAPGARLLLKDKAFGDRGTVERVLKVFEDNGVERERVTCMKFERSFASHLSVYSQVDIALDSYPYNGTTTTCEAAWMGVPTISLVGNCHRSRVGLSLLTAMGVPSLAAKSPEAFVETAKALSSNLQALAAFKSSFRNAMAASPLCDAKSFLPKYEGALKRVLGV